MGVGLRLCRIVVEALSPQLPDILRTYESSLLSANSSLLSVPDARRQCLDQAEYVVRDVIRGLAADGGWPDGASMELAREIGRSRAAARVHPAESLRAASILYEIVLNRISDMVAGDPDAATVLALAACALHLAIMTRIREASFSYVGSLLHSIQEALLTERRRIARELHDRVGYGMTAAARRLELHQLYVDRDPARARNDLVQAQQGLREALSCIRQVTADLRLQTKLESLENALKLYVLTATPAGVLVDIVVNGDEGWVRPDVLDELFLVAREALRNAFAHASPTNVLARVDIAPHEIHSVVADDGCGFVPETVTSGAGLASMQERVSLLGGRMSLSSRPGGGTLLEILLPVAAAIGDPR